MKEPNNNISSLGFLGKIYAVALATKAFECDEIGIKDRFPDHKKLNADDVEQTKITTTNQQPFFDKTKDLNPRKDYKRATFALGLLIGVVVAFFLLRSQDILLLQDFPLDSVIDFLEDFKSIVNRFYRLNVRFFAKWNTQRCSHY